MTPHYACGPAGGVRTGGNLKEASTPGPLGWQRPADWDLLWSPSASALKAADKIHAGQLICTVPGMHSITKKKKLPITLREVWRGSGVLVIGGPWNILP